MTTQVFPSLIGLAYPVPRKPMWMNKKPQSVAGLEAAFAYWSVPRFEWTLSYSILRSDPTYTELQQLMGFFNNRQGGFEVFLYRDADQNAVLAQGLGVGTGAQTNFQLVAAFGGFTMPILAPNVVTAVYLDSVVQNPSSYTVNAWDSSTPGVIVFNSAPSNGAVVTADYSYYFPCRFTDDEMSFDLFLDQMYENKKVTFRSIKTTQ